MDVDAAGISVKVTRITLGGLSTCHWLSASRGAGMGIQKSAEAIVGGLTSHRRAEPVSVVMYMLSGYSEQMPARGLKPEVADSIREVRLGA